MADSKGIDVRSSEQEPEVFASDEKWFQAQGSTFGKTDPQKRQEGKEDTVKILAGGLDYLKVYVWGGAAFPELFDRVRDLRAKAEAEDSLSDVHVTFGDDRHEWRVLPGEGLGQCRMHVVLQRGPVRIGLRQNPEGSKAPSAFFELSGQGCGGLQPRAAYKFCEKILLGFGVDIVRSTINRIDVHGDFVGLTIADLLCMEESERCVRRARTWRPLKNGRKWTGLNVGNRGQDVFCRIYDKTLELRQPGREEKAEHWRQTWGQEIPEGLVRVEFELRAEYFGGQSALNVCDFLGAHVEKLFTEWLRFTDVAVDRRQAQRAKAGEFWLQIMKGIQDRLGTAVVMPQPAPKKLPKAQKLVKGAFANLSSLAALYGWRVDSMEEVFGLLYRFASEDDERWLCRKAIEKAKRFAAQFAGLQECIPQEKLEGVEAQAEADEEDRIQELVGWVG